jgi:hypothetical protein
VRDGPAYQVVDDDNERVLSDGMLLDDEEWLDDLMT